MWALIFVLGLSLHPSSALFQGFGLDAIRNRTLPDIGRLFGVPWLTAFLLGPPACGPRDTCPNYPCRQNPAVVHGYCCGCASPFERIPFLCPLQTNCPLDIDGLCNRFHYIITCCCPDGPGPAENDDDESF